MWAYSKGEKPNNRVEFFLEVTNLYDCLGLASTVNLVARDLIDEREFVLVGKEGFVGGGGEMIL